MVEKMTFNEAFKRAVATFVFGALSAPVTSGWVDVDAWKLALASGVTALVNFVYRAVEAYLGDSK